MRMPLEDRISRRIVLGGLTAGAAGSIFGLKPSFAQQSSSLLTRAIPSSGEAVPLIGLGSWITFNVGDDPVSRKNSAAVMDRFFRFGGRMIDSSPMYGSSQEVIGEAVDKLKQAKQLFSATKVWISGKKDGIAQIEQSRALWRVPHFHLLQVHNLVSWEDHLETLAEMKSDNRLRYIGVTTSHGRRHDDLERIMRGRPIDFVQLTYNAADREAEERLLPLAAEKGIGVIVNRPFQGGALTEALEAEPVPGWAAEIDCRNWPQILLKYIVSHPAVTCAIPATSKVEHVAENMGACTGRLPDPAFRKRIASHIAEI